MNIKIIRTKGFTLIEVMIVVAIVGILTAIAVPSYTEYVRKGKRADAKVELLKLAQLQESYFVQNLSYASSLTAAQNAGGLGLTGPVTSEQGEYAITIPTLIPAGCNGRTGAGNTPCTGFTLSATAQGAQISDKCGNFSFSNTGVKGTTGTGETTQQCWK